MVDGLTGPHDDVRVAGRAAPGWDWVLLLPPGWVRLPTDAAEGRRAVRRLLDRRLRHLPRDQVAPGRRAVERSLLAQLGEARDAGASDVFAQFDLVRGLPVSAGLSVARIAVGPDDDALVRGLEAVLGEAGDVVESRSAMCAGQPALRRRRRAVRSLEGGEPRPHVFVDWLVELPDDELLLLAFGTVTEPVADALVALFDAVAQSLELVPQA